MRAKNFNTMYRRRTVRPDSAVYRQTRKIASGFARRGKTRNLAVGTLMLVGIACLLLAWLALR